MTCVPLCRSGVKWTAADGFTWPWIHVLIGFEELPYQPARGAVPWFSLLAAIYVNCAARSAWINETENFVKHPRSNCIQIPFPMSSQIMTNHFRNMQLLKLLKKSLLFDVQYSKLCKHVFSTSFNFQYGLRCPTWWSVGHMILHDRKYKVNRWKNEKLLSYKSCIFHLCY